MQPIALFWHRRDLRAHDNAGLFHALRSGLPVLPLFIFDRDILDGLPTDDRRVAYIHRQILRLHAVYRQAGSALLVRHGAPEQVWAELLDRLPVAQVHACRDYEPQAKARDAQVSRLLAERGARFFDHKDHVILDGAAVRTDAGAVYKVFTPYKNRWRAVLNDADLAPRPSEDLLGALEPVESPEDPPSLAQLGFREPEGLAIPPEDAPDALLERYAAQRDLLALDATSRLGVHLRFGAVSVRALARRARALSDVFLDELIWREFYSQILDQFPHVADSAFKPEYDRIPWREGAEAEEHFERWREGRTGYPIVDAGMRQLRETGFMHNRARMITASFLSKHLLIDWRRGERWFALQLLDFDLASNVGGWQWAAGTGVDAAPYFRVFSPSEQTRKFDPDLRYVRRWAPDFETLDYPAPIVEHKAARERALATYKKALAGE